MNKVSISVSSPNIALLRCVLVCVIAILVMMRIYYVSSLRWCVLGSD